MLQLIARTYSLARIFQVLQEWSILADIFVLTFSKVFLLHNHEENAPCVSFHLVKANLIYILHFCASRGRSSGEKQTKRHLRVLVRKRIWSPLVESHVNAMTQMTNPFFGGWLGGQKATVFVGEVLRKKQRKILSVTWKNYSMPTGFTLLHFNFRPLHWETQRKYEKNTNEMRRKILSVAMENYSMTQFNIVRVEADKLNFELSYIYVLCHE